MVRYFTIRPTDSDDNPDRKRWIYRELKQGRLREGWFSELPLVDTHGRLASKDNWVKEAQKVVKTWTSATPAQQLRFQKKAFCPKKFAELKQMTEIREGDCIVIPSLDESGGKSEFLLATARLADRGKLRTNCYWYDDRSNVSHRHVVSVHASDQGPVAFTTNDNEFVAKYLTRMIAPVRKVQKTDILKELDALRSRVGSIRGPLPPFKLSDEKQNRKKIDAQIADRQGQGEFRSRLLIAYKQSCAVSDCGVIEVLEAAHIVPHNLSALDDIRNGILLRADLHTLFDKGLIAINPVTRQIELHETVCKTYAQFDGRIIKEAEPSAHRPHLKALKRQYRFFKSKSAPQKAD
jgi:HNH endonuclease